MKARLIGESSGGMTAVEVRDDSDRLVWSHRWFDNGCSSSGYVSGLCDAWDCMRRCADAASFDGGEVDDDGDPIVMDDGGTTGVMLEYDTKVGWSLGEDARTLGQSSEIVDACIAIGLINADEGHEGAADSNVVVAITEYIKDQGIRTAARKGRAT